MRDGYEVVEGGNVREVSAGSAARARRAGDPRPPADRRGAERPDHRAPVSTPEPLALRRRARQGCGAAARARPRRRGRAVEDGPAARGPAPPGGRTRRRHLRNLLGAGVTTLLVGPGTVAPTSSRSVRAGPATTAPDGEPSRPSCRSPRPTLLGATVGTDPVRASCHARRPRDDLAGTVRVRNAASPWCSVRTRRSPDRSSRRSP